MSLNWADSESHLATFFSNFNRFPLLLDVILEDFFFAILLKTICPDITVMADIKLLTKRFTMQEVKSVREIDCKMLVKSFSFPLLTSHCISNLIRSTSKSVTRRPSPNTTPKNTSGVC